MEKRIRKILKKYDINTYNWKLEIAKEITALIQSEYVEKEFARWALVQGTVEFTDYYEFWLKEVKGVKQ